MSIVFQIIGIAYAVAGAVFIYLIFTNMERP